MVILTRMIMVVILKEGILIKSAIKIRRKNYVMFDDVEMFFF